MDERRTVFISHANPEDNEFASWLGSRLVNAGYDVWADILSLVGGEMISPAIGDVIRERAAVVIVVLSRASHRKEGVLDEVALAARVGRQLGRSRFLIPVVLDDLRTSEFPDELVRRLSVDFSRDWADGLSDVLTALEESETPRSVDGRNTAMAAWHAYKSRGSVLRTDVPELLFSNWFKLGPLPACIRYSRFGPSSDIDGAFKLFRSPVHSHHRLAISFADAETLMAEAQGVRLESAYEVDLADFLAGKPSGAPGLNRRDALNIATALLNGAWGRLCEERGLLRRGFVTGDSWFVPIGLLDKDQGVFTDDDGRTRRRQLASRSERRQVSWHFGVSARATIAEPGYLALRSHVVFSKDDGTVVEGNRAHQLRRSFCKSWWNARWRDMLRAFVANLACDADQIELPLSPETAVTVATVPMRFRAPVWVDDDDAMPRTLEEDEAVNDDEPFDEASEEEDWT